MTKQSDISRLVWETFKSEELDLPLNGKLIGSFLPELYKRLRDEAHPKEQGYGVKPFSDIQMVQEFPDSKSSSYSYHPNLTREDAVYVTRIVIRAPTVEEDANLGLRNAVLGEITHNEDSSGRILHMNARDDWAIDPQAVLDVAKNYR